MSARHYMLVSSLTLAILNSSAVQAQDVSADSDGITIKSASGDSEFQIGGRLHLDSVHFDDDVTLFEDQTDIRRARLYFSAKFGDDWKLMVDRDIGGTSRGWKNLWLSYKGFDNLTLKVGQMIAPVGMEEMMSSNDLLFMERGLTSALAPGFLRGIQGSYARDDWSATLGYFGNAQNVGFGKSSATGNSVIGRVTYSPFHSRKNALHLGLSYERRNLDTGSAFRILSSPEAGLTTTSLLDTGNLTDVENLSRMGLEGAWIRGPFTAQAEYISMDVSRPAFSDLEFDGWYVQAGYMLTGESHRYSVSRGNLGEVRPQRKWGAVELAIRHSALDLQDGTVTGGKQEDNSFGVNWYIGRNFRLMGNYTRAKATPSKLGVDESVGIYQVRAQVDF